LKISLALVIFILLQEGRGFVVENNICSMSTIGRGFVDINGVGFVHIIGTAYPSGAPEFTPGF
jgi:predicted nucleic acid-binding Zn finger protein